MKKLAIYTVCTLALSLFAISADAGVLRYTYHHSKPAVKKVAKGAGKVVAGTAKVAYKVVY